MTLRNAFADLALEHPSAGLDAQLISGNKVKYRRDFVHVDNPAFLADFDVVIGSGQTVTSGTGNLIMTTGTTANATSTATSKQMFTAPFGASFGFKVSQKIINQEFYVEIVACDPVTGVVDETVVAAWRVAGSDSTTTTFAQYQVRNQGAARLSSANVTIPAVTTDFIFEIVLESDEVWFHAKAMDAVTGRTVSFARQSVCPSPLKTYKLRYRVVNGATAPLSTTTLTSAFIAGTDNTDLKVEVTGGQGSTNAGQGIAVTPTGTINAQLLPSATLLAGTPFKVIAAATTNATLIKASAARVISMQLSNTTTAFKFVKFYNQSTAPTVGTTVPVYTVAIPPNTSITYSPQYSLTHSSGLGIGITGAYADNDATAVAVGDVIGHINYV